jgi:predicted DCC family thiol-disulfide oxidoreductase YuxK
MLENISKIYKINKEMNTPEFKKQKSWQLLFDEECAFCRRFAGIVEKFGKGRIHNISLQEHYKKYGSIDLDTLLEEVHLLNSDGLVLKGADAVNKVIALIPEAKPFRWLIESRWGRKGSKVIYSALKRFRNCSRCK